MRKQTTLRKQDEDHLPSARIGYAGALRSRFRSANVGGNHQARVNDVLKPRKFVAAALRPRKARATKR